MGKFIKPIFNSLYYSFVYFVDALKKTRLDHQPTHHDIKIVIIEDLKHAKDRKTSRERRLKKKDTRKATTSRNIFDSDEDN